MARTSWLSEWSRIRACAPSSITNSTGAAGVATSTCTKAGKDLTLRCRCRQPQKVVYLSPCRRTNAAADKPLFSNADTILARCAASIRADRSRREPLIVFIAHIFTTPCRRAIVGPSFTAYGLSVGMDLLRTRKTYLFKG